LLSADLTYYTCFNAVCQEVFLIFLKKIRQKNTGAKICSCKNIYLFFI